MSEASTLVHKKVSLDEMLAAVTRAAADLDAGHSAAVAAGFCQRKPDIDERIRALESACRLIEIVQEVEGDFRRLVMRKRGIIAGNRRRAG